MEGGVPGGGGGMSAMRGMVTELTYAPMVKLVTGGTGFIGRHRRRELAKRDGDTYVLVLEPSRARLERLIASLGATSRMHALAGDVTTPELGLAAADQARL